MNRDLQRQIQEYRPQCRCVDEFGTDNNPYNDRCSICDEGASGVADKIAKATQLCVETSRRAFKENWDNEVKIFMKYLGEEELKIILDFRNPSDLLDWLEEYEGNWTFQRFSDLLDWFAEYEGNRIFQSFAMNLRLQKNSDQKFMLGEISYYAANELWILNEKKRKEKKNEPQKKRIIRKKVCNGLRCSEHSYEPMDCWYDCPQCCERGHP